MMKTASEIQKDRIKEIEDKATELLAKCDVVTLASINENSYPRICTVSKAKAIDFHEIYFVTSKRSQYNGKATHFENNHRASVGYSLNGDSVTLIGDIDIITDMEVKRQFEKVAISKFFAKGVEDPKFYLLRFRTVEATFWIEGKFRTVKYKL